MENGFVDLDKLNKIISNNTVVTSIMYANNEIGTIQPIKEIGEIVHNKGKYFHQLTFKKIILIYYLFLQMIFMVLEVQVYYMLNLV